MLRSIYPKTLSHGSFAGSLVPVGHIYEMKVLGSWLEFRALSDLTPSLHTVLQEVLRLGRRRPS